MNKNMRNGLLVLFVGAVIWFMPVPAGLKVQAWHLFAIFVATILGYILQPLPIGAIAFMAVTFSAFSGTLKIADALMGYGNGTMWLIVSAFLFARGFIKSGLGRRIAFVIIKFIGRSSLTLRYAITLSDFIISPATPSSAARAGGIIFPIIKSLSSALGSEPGPTARKFGAYIMQVEYHANAITCGMFMTAMAGNPLAVELASKAIGIQITWATWALAAIVPGAVSLLLTPYLLYKLYPPEITLMPDAKGLAMKELETMGPTTKIEKIVAFIFIGAMTLWATSGITNIDATVVAMSAVCVMIIFQVLTWEDIICEKGAWDTLFWMGSLVALATELAKSGFIAWIAKSAGVVIASASLPWITAFAILIIVYVYSHYGFASVTAHISAMYAAFLAISVGAGAPPLLAALAFAFLSNVMIPLTHYSGAAGPILFGAGYVTQAEWWRLGFILTTVNVIVWLGIGGAWWKVLGLW
jgi:DASS family divalent anion:Na+ symporter